MDKQKNLLIIVGEWWQQRQLQQDSTAQNSWRSWLPGRGNVLFTLLMISLLLWVQSAGAVAPFAVNSATTASTGTIAYQGRLADSRGAPLTSTENMIFRLYGQASGGAPLWTEQWTGSNGVQVSDGLFNVMLGSLTPIPQSVITGNSTLFLGITVGTDDEMSPRVQLGSVPWAVQALTVPDGSITTVKVAEKSITQDKLADNVKLTVDADVLQWENPQDVPFDASGGAARRTIQETGIDITVPAAESHIYLVLYSTDFGYLYGERVGNNDGFYGAWSADLLLGSSEAGSRTLITTGNRSNWASLGNSVYWWSRTSTSWLVEVGEGTHAIRFGISGYSDGTMNTAHVRNQIVEIVRLH